MEHDQWLLSGPGGPEDSSDCVGTCPTCKGEGEVICHQDFDCGTINMICDCPECKGTGVICG
jgi:DnaJ-class molecular chaperone